MVFTAHEKVASKLADQKVEQLLRALAEHYRCTSEKISCGFYTRTDAENPSVTEVCPGIQPPFGVVDRMEAIASVELKMSDVDRAGTMHVNIRVDCLPVWRDVFRAALEDDHGK